MTSSTSTINSYGYSPHPLSTYLEWAEVLLASEPPPSSPRKPIILSVTGSTVSEVHTIISLIQAFRKAKPEYSDRIAIELNTSCPNIHGTGAPKGYIMDTDSTMLDILADFTEAVKQDPTLTVGLKLPPYIYRDQFVRVVELVKTLGDAFSFFTCTNTLGNSLLFSEQVESNEESISGYAVPPAVGGIAGDAIHALTLGNVHTFKTLLEESGLDSRIKIIGVGGATSSEAVQRLRKAGASVVGCATLLGKEGVKAFEILSQ